MHDQLAQYVCYTPGDGGTWTFLRNVSTGDQGWVRDDLLGGYGSRQLCDENPPPAVASVIQAPALAVPPGPAKPVDPWTAALSMLTTLF